MVDIMYYYPNQPSMQNAGMYNNIPANPFAYGGYNNGMAMQMIQNNSNDNYVTETLDLGEDFNLYCNPQVNGYDSNAAYMYDYMNNMQQQYNMQMQQMLYQQQLQYNQQIMQQYYPMVQQNQNMFAQPQTYTSNVQTQQHSSYDNGNMSNQQKEWHPQTDKEMKAFNLAKMQQILQMQQQAYQQPQMQQQMIYQQPQQMQQGVVPIGYGGYNQQQTGGYYSGNYMNFYQQQQIQAYNEAMHKEQQYQSDIMKTLFKSACAFSGREATEEELKFYDTKPQNNPMMDDEDLSGLTFEEQMEYRTRKANDIALEKRTNHCMYMQTVDLTAARQAYLNNINVQAFNKERERVPADTDLYTYLKEYAPFEYFEAQQAQNKSMLGANKLYNSKDYNNLLEQHKSTLFGNSLNPFANTDDQEIHLPTYISSEERQARRKAFFDTIFQNQKGDGN